MCIAGHSRQRLNQRHLCEGDKITCLMGLNLFGQHLFTASAKITMLKKNVSVPVIIKMKTLNAMFVKVNRGGKNLIF